MLSDADDMRHALHGPLARESQFLTVPLPKEKLNIHLYWWVDSAGVAGRVVSLFTDDNRRLLFDRQDGVAMGTRDFDDWQVAGLRVRHEVPLQIANFHYDDGRYAFDIRFEALHRAFAYSENVGGCPRCMADDRFEQAGLVRGYLSLGERVIEFDTTGHRDHSWGRRDYKAMHHFKWIAAQIGADMALNGFQLLADGEQTINGYLFCGGMLAPLVAMQTTVDYDAVFAPRSLVFTLTDDRNRMVVVRAKRFSHLRWEALPIVMDDIGCTVEIDGRTGPSHIGLAWTREFLDRYLS